jgi:uncharacterized protein YcbK (DUF882 family)
MSAKGDATLPEQVAYTPVVKPGSEFAAIAKSTIDKAEATKGQATDDASAPAATDAAQTASADAPAAPKTVVKAATSPRDQNQTVVTATDPAASASTEPKKRGLFAALFNGSPATEPAVQASAPAATDEAQAVKTDGNASAAAPKPAPLPSAKDAASSSPDKNQVVVTATDPAAPAQPEPKKRGFLAAFFGASPAAAAPAKSERSAPFVQLASAAPAKVEKPQPAAKSEEDTEPLAVRASLDGGELNALPGVRQTMLFEIKRKSGLDDDSDIDLHEDELGGSYQVASAAGLARMAPNGLLTQTERVDAACLKPALVRVLKIVESHYGRKIMVTSGYRSPEHNRAARGAKNSLHMYCAAADVQVPGISKWELASFVRNMPGRGGVGTYCNTDSVHIDVGPERDWNWRCRRRM